MTYDEVKNYLRIDEDEDENLIKIMMSATEQYIKDAVGFYEEENAKMKMLYVLIIQDMYENRFLSITSNVEYKQHITHIASSIVLQLQVEALTKERSEDG